MEPQAYSAFADLLNKFHTSSEPIQALWLVAVPVTVVGVVWCLTRFMRDVAVAAMRPRRAAGSLLVYGVVQEEDGRWHVIRHGHPPQPLDQHSPPRERVRRSPI